MLVSPRLFIVSTVNFTSSAEKSAPFCHFTFSLSFTRYVKLSVFENSSASAFSSLYSPFMSNSGSYINLLMSCMFWFLEISGFRLSRFDIPQS